MAKVAGYGLGFACFALVAALAGATQFQVGGNGGWSVAGASAQSYNTWAMKNRFQIGDTLVFVYPKDKDSVLVVQPADYNACNTSSYDKKFSDGNTVFTLDRAGAFFFISGVDANCRANEKLIVMVLAGRNGNASGGSAPSPLSPAAPPPASNTPPPAASPAPSASSPPPATATPPAPAVAPKAASPTSSPPPAPASAPATPPSSAPPASSPPSAPPSSSPPSPTPSAPAGAPPMPPAANAPGGADGGSTNSTGASPPAGSSDQSGAGITVTGAAGLAGSAAACIVGYAMLAL